MYILYYIIYVQNLYLYYIWLNRPTGRFDQVSPRKRKSYTSGMGILAPNVLERHTTGCPPLMVCKRIVVTYIAHLWNYITNNLWPVYDIKSMVYYYYYYYY